MENQSKSGEFCVFQETIQAGLSLPEGLFFTFCPSWILPWWLSQLWSQLHFPAPVLPGFQKLLQSDLPWAMTGLHSDSSSTQLGKQGLELSGGEAHYFLGPSDVRPVLQENLQVVKPLPGDTVNWNCVNLYFNLQRTKTFTTLSLPIKESEVPLKLFFFYVLQCHF
jgi:hypothetical protein